MTCLIKVQIVLICLGVASVIIVRVLFESHVSFRCVQDFQPFFRPQSAFEHLRPDFNVITTSNSFSKGYVQNPSFIDCTNSRTDEDLFFICKLCIALKTDV